MNFTVWVLQEWKRTLACQGAVVCLRSFGLKLEHDRNHEAMKQWRHTNLLRCCTKLFFPFLPSDFEDDDEELSTEAPRVLMCAILIYLPKQLIRFKIEAFGNTLQLFKRGASKPAGTQRLCRGLVITTFWNQERTQLRIAPTFTLQPGIWCHSL